MLRAALFAVPVLLCGYGLAPTLALAVPAFVAVGAGYICVLSGLNTVVQLRAPVAARGRILSHLHDGPRTHLSRGAVIQGRLANTHGIRAVTVAAALALLALVTLTAVARPTIFANLADPPTADGPGGGPVEVVADPDPASAGGGV